MIPRISGRSLVKRTQDYMGGELIALASSERAYHPDMPIE
jgi:hypothetical protein